MLPYLDRVNRLRDIERRHAKAKSDSSIMWPRGLSTSGTRLILIQEEKQSLLTLTPTRRRTQSVLEGVSPLALSRAFKVRKRGVSEERARRLFNNQSCHNPVRRQAAAMMHALIFAEGFLDGLAVNAIWDAIKYLLFAGGFAAVITFARKFSRKISIGEEARTWVGTVLLAGIFAMLLVGYSSDRANSKPRLKMEPMEFRIGSATNDSSALYMYASMTILNTGRPSVIREPRLFVKLAGTTSFVPTLTVNVLDEMVDFPSAMGGTVKVSKQDWLQNSATLVPIPTGGAARGYLAFHLVGYSLNLLRKPGTVFQLVLKDSEDQLYTHDFNP